MSVRCGDVLAGRINAGAVGVVIQRLLPLRIQSAACVRERQQQAGLVATHVLRGRDKATVARNSHPTNVTSCGVPPLGVLNRATGPVPAIIELRVNKYTTLPPPTTKKSPVFAMATERNGTRSGAIQVKGWLMLPCCEIVSK